MVRAVREAVRRKVCPQWWREDFRFLKTDSLGERTHLEIVGPKGIGKTWLSGYLARSLGEISAVSSRRPKDLPVEWRTFFEEVLLAQERFIASTDVEWESKLQRLKRIHNRIELEIEKLSVHDETFTTNTEGLIRQEFSLVAKMAHSRPDFVTALFSKRLLLVCVAEDSVQRCIEGQRARGDRFVDNENFREDIRKKVADIEKAAAILRSLDVPVAFVNMDLQDSEIIRVISGFLQDNQVSSRAIRKFAKSRG